MVKPQTDFDVWIQIHCRCMQGKLQKYISLSTRGPWCMLWMTPLFRLWLITIAARNQKFQLWCLNQFVENRTLALTFSEYRASKLRLNKWESISAHSNLESRQKPFSTTNFSWVSAEPSAHSSCFQTPRELTQPICIHILDAKLNFDFYCFSSAYYSLYCCSVSSAWFHHYLTNL